MNTYKLNAGQFRTTILALDIAHEELHKNNPDESCKAITEVQAKLERQLQDHMDSGRAANGAVLNFSLSSAQAAVVLDAIATFHGTLEGMAATTGLELPQSALDALERTKAAFATALN